MPFRSGFLSHDVRGTVPPWVWTAPGFTATNPSVTINAAGARRTKKRLHSVRISADPLLVVRKAEVYPDIMSA
jgi:hypothetical protein